MTMAFRTRKDQPEDLKRELTDIIRYVKDPRVSSILTIIKVELSNDLSHCKVYHSSLEGMEKAKWKRQRDSTMQTASSSMR